MGHLLSHRKYPMIVVFFSLRHLFCFSNLHVNHKPKPLHLLCCRRLTCLFSYRKNLQIFLPSVEITWMLFANLFICCLYSVCKIDSFICVACVCIWMSEENFWSMLSFLPCSYGDWTQVLGHGSKQLFLLSISLMLILTVLKLDFPCKSKTNHCFYKKISHIY